MRCPKGVRDDGSDWGPLTQGSTDLFGLNRELLVAWAADLEPAPDPENGNPGERK
jgi:hypothetical protein